MFINSIHWTANPPLGDLPKYATENDLHSLFQSYGPVLDVKIKKNAVTGKSLAYGFVTQATWEAANATKDALDSDMLMGRKLR
ncbi:RNA-binding protein [archaeon]|nr:MAG: RNA-binding protein [archaeon]